MTGGKRKHDYDAILGRWQVGETQGQIARALGVSTTMIRQIVSAERAKGDPRAVVRGQKAPGPVLAPEGSSGWTATRLAEAERLYEAGCTASEIAAAIGGDLTRNAVIGMAHRRRWNGVAPVPRASATKPRAGRSSLANKIAPGSVRKRRAVAVRPPEPVHIPYAGPRYGILDDRLGSFMCRAIVEGSGPTTLFCSAPTIDGSPFRFCLDHAAAYLTAPRQSGWTEDRRDRHVAMLRKRAGVAA